MLPDPLPPGAIISISDGRTSACATRSRLAGGSGEKEAAEAVTPPPAFCSHPPPPPPSFISEGHLHRKRDFCFWCLCQLLLPVPHLEARLFPSGCDLGKMWSGFGDMHQCGCFPEHPCLPQPHPTTQRFTILPSKSSSKAAQGHQWEVSGCFWAHVPCYPCLSFPGQGCTGARKLQRAAVRINYHP